MKPSPLSSKDELLPPEAIHPVIETLKKEARRWRVPVVTGLARKRPDPFRVLVACLISSRTKDEVTSRAVSRLFSAASEPEAMAALGVRRIARLIYPAGFYKTKARHIVELCRELSRRWGGRVPDSIEELVKLPGVGRKTANLVLSRGFFKPAICVDTHVHRICNRLGYVRTKSPEETEQALRQKLPREHWMVINDLFVAFGQQLCTPVSPRCSLCPVAGHCQKVGVERSR